MNPVCAEVYLKRGEKAKNTNNVGTVKHLRLQLYLNTLPGLCNSTCHFAIVLLGPVLQGIAVVAQGRLLVCIHCDDDGERLFCRMVVSFAACINRKMAGTAPILQGIVRIVVIYRTTSFPYRFSEAVATG